MYLIDLANYPIAQHHSSDFFPISQICPGMLKEVCFKLAVPRSVKKIIMLSKQSAGLLPLGTENMQYTCAIFRYVNKIILQGLYIYENYVFLVHICPKKSLFRGTSCSIQCLN